MNKTLKKSLAMAFVGLLLMAGSALAIPIVGDISMSGGWTPTGGSGILGATGIHFGADTLVSNSPTAPTGDFTGLGGVSVTMQDFQFDPLVPNDPLWSVGGFSFDLDSVSILFRNANILAIEGTGTIAAAGYDDTVGNWFFTGQTAGGSTLSWSSSNAAAVPEPMTMLLMGTGLAGLMIIRRKRED